MTTETSPVPAQDAIGSGGNPIARYSPALVASFTRYLRWYLSRNFHAVRVSRTGLPHVPDERPLIVYANHASWWDPAIFFLLQSAFTPGRRGFGPMEAVALTQYKVFRRLGVFGLEPGMRGAARFLRVGRQVLADPRNALWITAEGTFTDPRDRPLRLRPGLAHIVRSTREAVVLPLAVEYPFWNERKPEALARFGPPVAVGCARDTRALTERLTEELTAAMDALALEARARDATLFLTLARGTAGVGFAYDAWRRARALLVGRRFDPSHEGRNR